ncbi:MAG: ORF6N domain-containing protein [Chitinophagaceae bacterium]
MLPQLIQQKIFEVRGQKVMLDFDLADLYEVETKVFNQSVKRNIENFPDNFMFRLTRKEWSSLRSQFVTSSSENVDNLSDSFSQTFSSSIQHGGTRYLPLAFTEHGVTMLASVLKSPKARKMNIAIVRAFIALKEFALNYGELAGQLVELKLKVGVHDIQLKKIYEAIENLLTKKKQEEDWKARQRIGFKKS